MARYIDADKFKSNLEKAMEKMHLIGGVKAVDVGAVIVALDRQPTADVAPKSEVDRLKAVMKDMDEQRAYTINMLGEKLENAKSEEERLHIEIEALKIANEKMHSANKAQEAETENWKAEAESWHRTADLYAKRLVENKVKVTEEYRQRVNTKMGKHTHLLGKEYVQRILREVAKEMKNDH